MNILAAESERRRSLSLSVDDTVTRNDSRLGIDMQGIPDNTGKAGIARHGGYHSVCRDPSPRYPFYVFIYAFKRVHFFLQTPFREKYTNTFPGKDE